MLSVSDSIINSSWWLPSLFKAELKHKPLLNCYWDTVIVLPLILSCISQSWVKKLFANTYLCSFIQSSSVCFWFLDWRLPRRDPLMILSVVALHLRQVMKVSSAFFKISLSLPVCFLVSSEDNSYLFWTSGIRPPPLWWCYIALSSLALVFPGSAQHWLFFPCGQECHSKDPRGSSDVMFWDPNHGKHGTHSIVYQCFSYLKTS